MSSQTAPYGTWSSPITADAITKNAVKISDILVDPVTSTVYHIESRPSEKGRNVVVNTLTGRDVTVGKEWNFRTGVHEYGGASTIVHGGIVYFSQYGSGGNGPVYRVKEGEEPEAVTPEEGEPHRFAAFAMHPVHTHLLVAVLEDHTIDEPAKIVNTLCVINAHNKTVKSIITGVDFYGCPKFSPDGTRFAWQQWSHPDMPWEGAEVHVGDIVVDPDLGGLSIKNGIHITGKANDISCGYMEWTRNGTLIFTSDESKFINPWKYTNGKCTPLFPKSVPQEFGSPLWTLNTFPYAILDKENKYALFIAIKDGRDELQLVDLEGGTEPQRIETPYVVIEGLRSLSKENQEVVFLGEKADEKGSIVKCTILTSRDSPQATFTLIKSETASETSFPKEIISMPQFLTIQGRKGDVHVIFFPPRNPQYSGSDIDGERPPCVVHVHGGPTGLQKSGLNWIIQYFTSRGWAWLTVNYGGSTGYGREYIKRLEGAWGEVDVEDTISAAKSISSAPYNLVDAERMFIRGGSAGGWTVLCALSYGSDRKTFAAGNAMYGVTDLNSFVDGTHKFESKYLLKLIGAKGVESPEDLAILKRKSPVTHGKNIEVPLLILQGGIDKVVPKQQADEMVKAITNAYVEYEVYPEEGHGWRQEKNIKAALLREIDFYEGVLKLKGKCLKL